MFTIRARNVNDAWAAVLELVWDESVPAPSRAGPIYRLPEPLAVRFAKPCERVLLDPARDANPFFHLFEALWMLGGRSDVAWIAQFNKRMADFSENGVTLPASYGFRWREHFGHDQIVSFTRGVVALLKRDPDTRRAVLAMWDGAIDGGLAMRGGKDLPCNLNVVFARRPEGLCMTVFNRSNDLAWGMLGANAVHMSVLQEFVAAAVGCPVGWYEQVSMDAHAYVDHWPGALPHEGTGHWNRVTLPNPYETEDPAYVKASPLIRDVEPWLSDLAAFLDPRWEEAVFSEPFFVNTARPMRRAWLQRKLNPGLALETAGQIGAPDWRRACTEWLGRYQQRRAQAALAKEMDL